MQSFEDPLRPPDPDLALVLREALTAAGFTEKGLQEGVAVQIGPSGGPRGAAVFARRFATGSPRDVLVRLLSLGQRVPAAVAEQLLGVPLPDLEQLGVLATAGDTVRAKVTVTPRFGLLLAHDQPGDGHVDVAADFVPGVGPAPTTLANFTVRRPVARALDLGTGCGVQALLAARHADEVVATDVNPRALSFTAFNAALNDLGNVECRQGSWFEPVEGERFDLIVSNPPYVISPETGSIFRDSGLPGHELCEGLVRRMPSYLATGGFATLLVNWTYPAGTEWSVPLKKWVEGTGADAWLAHHATHDPLSYAVMWNEGLLDADRFAGALDTWLAYYAEQNVDAIAAGVVVLRRSGSSTSWVRTDQVTHQPGGPTSDHLLRIFAAEDFLAATDDGTLRALTLAVADDHRVEQVLAPEAGRYVLEEVRLRLAGGLALHGTLDAQVFAMLVRLVAGVPVADAISAVVESEDGDGALAQVLLDVVRGLVARGFLLPR